MRFVKYFAAPWAAFIFYAAASFLTGNIGLSAYEDFDVERRKQLENIAELRKMNNVLIAEKEALSSDPDTIARKAIDIGYGRNGETYVRIEGFNGASKPQLHAGELFKPVEPDAVDDDILKMYAIGIFIIVLGTLGVTDILRLIRSA